MIKHRSVYEPEGPDEGYRVLVMRRWPRGKRKSICDLWLPNLGPTAQTLDLYRSGAISWQEFLQKYREETATTAQEDMGKVLQAEREKGTVTLLCWERPDQYGQLHCHRVELKSVLESLRARQS